MTDIGKKTSPKKGATQGQTAHTSIDLNKIAGLQQDPSPVEPGDEQKQLSAKVLEIINEYVPKIKAELLRTTARSVVVVNLVSEAEKKGVKGKLAMTHLGRQVGIHYSSLRKMVNVSRDEGLKAFLES